MGCVTSMADTWEIFADTMGQDNATTAEFYGIEFLSGSGEQFIQSVTYDLSVDAGGFFDLDGGQNFGMKTEPYLGTLVGRLTAEDITFDLLDPVGGHPLHPARLRLNFTANSFGVGDSLRFAVDTDFFVSDPAPGSVFGQAGAPISATMFGGAFGSANFAVVSDTRSEAIITPEPATALLVGLGGLALLRKHRSEKRKVKSAKP